MFDANVIDTYKNFPAQVKSSIVLTLILSIVIVILGMKIKKIKPTDKPPKIILAFEILVNIINNACKSNIGKRWKAYAPYFLTLTIILFFFNTAGLWGLTPPTSYISINFSFGITTFFIIQITGIVSLGLKNYLKSNFMPFEAKFPMNLINILLAPITIVGEIALPFSLSIRLFGNILSGNVFTMLITGGFLSIGIFMAPLIVMILPVINVIFDIGFGVIQVLVFVLLSLVFTSMRVDDTEKNLI